MLSGSVLSHGVQAAHSVMRCATAGGPAEDIITRSKRDKVPYQTWAERGFITPAPGEVMDQGYIHRQILEDCGRYDVRAGG